MPHIDIEYSSNLQQVVDSTRMVDVIHQAALATGAFPRWGVRTFAKAIERFRIGECEVDNGLIRIIVRISPGRDLAVKQAIARSLFDAACGMLEPLYCEKRVGCQLEIQEFEAALSLARYQLPGSP